MAAMSPTRKRVAVAIVVVGSALIAGRVVALMDGASEDGTSEDGTSEGSAVVRAVEPRTSDQRAGRPASAEAPPRSAAKSAAESVSMAAESRAAGPQVRLDRLAARQRALAADDESADAAPPALFGAVSWQPSPPPAQRAAETAPPPPPVAPPFPYAYLGGLSEDGVRTAFFTQGERVLPVKAGDTVDAVYRIDQMTEKLMTLTYLPLKQSLSLALGGKR